MFLEAIILFFAFHQCSNNKKNNITVFTNYNNEIEADFFALAIIVWNDVLLKILHFIVLENNQEEISRNDSTNKFLTEMLLSKKPKAFDNIHKFNLEFRPKLLELKNKVLKHTEFVYIIDNETKSWLKSLNKSYYNFIDAHKKALIKNESLQTFYALCFFYRRKIAEVDKSIDIKLSVDFYSTDKLDVFDFKCVDCRIVLSTEISGYILGIFILPVFNGGCLHMDSTKTTLEIFKNLEIHVYKHIMLRSKRNINFNYFFNIVLQNYKPINLYQNFDILTFNNIYEKLNNCFWLCYGFESYQNLGKYFEVYEVCNPNYFKLPVKLNNDNCLTNLKFSIPIPIKTNKIYDKNTIYISSNYLTYTKHSEYGSYNNNLLIPLLEYATLRLALEKFKFCYNFDVIKQYFDIEDMERNFEEINKLLGTGAKSEEAIVDNKEKGREMNLERIKRRMKKKLEEKMQKEPTIVINNGNGKCNFVGKYENENCKNNYVQIYYICLIIYKEISQVFTNMGIKNVENVFSINYFVYSFMKKLTQYGLNDDIILEKFFSEFLCKQTCAHICIFINESIKAIKTKNNNKSNENLNGMDIEDFSDNKTHTIIEQIYLFEKNIIINKKKLFCIDSKCNNDLIIFSLLITSGIWAILTSVASYLTATEYFYYLIKAAFISNVKHSKNVFKEKLHANNIELCFYNYSSINFQEIIEKSLGNDVKLKSRPIFLYYNYYICYDPVNDETLPENLDENIQAEVNTILKFKTSFIAQKDSVRNFNVFVFNIVLMFKQRQSHNQYIIRNVKYDNDYNLRLKKLHELITKHLKIKRIKLPKRFILKHDNMSIDENTKFFDGHKLHDQCAYKNYKK